MGVDEREEERATGGQGGGSGALDRGQGGDADGGEASVSGGEGGEERLAEEGAQGVMGVEGCSLFGSDPNNGAAKSLALRRDCAHVLFEPQRLALEGIRREVGQLTRMGVAVTFYIVLDVISLSAPGQRGVALQGRLQHERPTRRRRSVTGRGRGGRRRRRRDNEGQAAVRGQEGARGSQGRSASSYVGARDRGSTVESSGREAVGGAVGEDGEGSGAADRSASIRRRRGRGASSRRDAKQTIVGRVVLASHDVVTASIVRGVGQAARTRG